MEVRGQLQASVALHLLREIFLLKGVKCLFADVTYWVTSWFVQRLWSTEFSDRMKMLQKWESTTDIHRLDMETSWKIDNWKNEKKT